MPQDIISQFDRKYNGPIETARQVQSIAIRDSIITSKRWEGMIVYVVDDQANYVLKGGVDNTKWELLEGIGEAPEDAGYYARKDGAWAPFTPGGISQEVGTFTAELIDVDAGATYSATLKEFNYVKTGKLVYLSIVFFNISYTGTPTGNLMITGLPFTVAASGSFAISIFKGSNVSADDVRSAVGIVSKDPSNNIGIANKDDVFSGVTFVAGQLYLMGTYITSD